MGGGAGFVPFKRTETGIRQKATHPCRCGLGGAAEAGGLTARGWTRTLRLARTIADLEGADAVHRVHVAEALIYRRVAPPGVGVASAVLAD